MSKNQNYLCSDCKYYGTSSRLKKGSKKTEIFWWVAFTPVAIFYSLYRICGAVKSCPKCGSTNLVKTNSQLLEDAVIKNQIDA